jgi:protease secretion system outer membrane protein
MKPMTTMVGCAVAACFLLAARGACALGLVQAYEAALLHDPVYRAAVHAGEAGQEAGILGRANLLPMVAMNYSASRNSADVTTLNPLGQSSRSHPDYNSSVAAISVRQAIWYQEGTARYRQGLAQVALSDAQLTGKKRELIVRLVGSYADTQYAQDQLALAMAQRDALSEQRRFNDRRFQKGEGTRTDLLETQAKLNLAEAQLIEANDGLVTARAALAAIVGKEVLELDSVLDNVRVPALVPAGFEDWKSIAQANNADIAAQRRAVEVAEEEVNKARAGHTPRLDLVAGFNRNESETASTYNQNANVRSIGLQLNVPLYAGGYVDAATRQATGNHEKAKAELDGVADKVMVDLRKHHAAVASGTPRIEALRQSVESAKLLMHATKESIKGGVRVNLDLLNAQQQFYINKRDLAQARYSHLLSYLRLQQAAGTLDGGHLRDVVAQPR